MSERDLVDIFNDLERDFRTGKKARSDESVAAGTEAHKRDRILPYDIYIPKESKVARVTREPGVADAAQEESKQSYEQLTYRELYFAWQTAQQHNGEIPAHTCEAIVSAVHQRTDVSIQFEAVLMSLRLFHGNEIVDDITVRAGQKILKRRRGSQSEVERFKDALNEYLRSGSYENFMAQMEKPHENE